MSWHLILCVLLICVIATKGLQIVKRSPEEHVPHESRFEATGDLDLNDYPPLRGIEPALPPHLRYLEATPTELHFARERTRNAEDSVSEGSSARKLIEDNSTFDVTSGNITINDQMRVITETFGGDELDINSTQSLETVSPETIVTMKTTLRADTISTNNKMSSLKNRSISNRQPARSLSDKQPISRSTTTRYINETNNREERKELVGKNEESSRNKDTFDPFQYHHIPETKTSTHTPEKLSTVTESQDDVVDGFMNRIQDHWIQFVQQMKHSVMDVWQTITSRIMNSLENFSVTTS